MQIVFDATPLHQSKMGSITDKNTRSNDRTDIGVLKTKAVNVYCEGYGVRDISLRVDADDVEVFVEVKLCPHLYVKKRAEKLTSMWVDDLIKLYQLERLNIPSRILLCIDTSLPIDVGGLRYANTAWAKKRVNERKAPDRLDVVGLWPLVHNQVHQLRSYPSGGKRGGSWDVDLMPVDGTLATADLHLWALGVNDPEKEGALLPTDGKHGGTLSTTDVTASCWRVEVARTNMS